MNSELIKRDEIEELTGWKITSITNQEQYEDYTLKIAFCRNYIDRVEEYWKPQIQSAYQTHKALCKKRDEMVKPIRAVMSKIQDMVNKYTSSRKTIDNKSIDNVSTVVVEKTVVDVKDIVALCKAVAEGKVPSACVMANIGELQKLAEITNDIPGCAVRKIKETIVRRTRQ